MGTECCPSERERFGQVAEEPIAPAVVIMGQRPIAAAWHNCAQIRAKTFHPHPCRTHPLPVPQPALWIIEAAAPRPRYLNRARRVPHATTRPFAGSEVFLLPPHAGCR